MRYKVQRYSNEREEWVDTPYTLDLREEAEDYARERVEFWAKEAVLMKYRIKEINES
jgi:hypothetical protein